MHGVQSFIKGHRKSGVISIKQGRIEPPKEARGHATLIQLYRGRNAGGY